MHSLFRIFRDHGHRCLLATRGFRHLGMSWLTPWAAYCVSPMLSRAIPEEIVEVAGFRARCGQCDLYTLGNLFEDYRLAPLVEALRQVSLVVDAGANVGAFSWLVLQMARQLRADLRVIAVEPDSANAHFLRRQPFASEVEILEAALAGHDGTGRLARGENSVTHRLSDSGTDTPGQDVTLVSLPKLCAGLPTLLKMDIEGGELEVLRAGLPPEVRFLFLEWHPGPGWPAHPAELIPHGTWWEYSRDLWGSACYFWRAHD